MELPTHTDIAENTPRKGIPAFRLIEDQLNQVRQLINEQLIVPPTGAEINRLLEYMKTRSGKMIRPGLVLLSYRAVHDASAFAGASLPLRGTPPHLSSTGRRGGNQKQGCEKNTQYAIRNTQYKAIRVAAIVEMIHNATLLHDDVIDEGQKRRGLPTINSLWGNESAVLLGDFLLSQVFKMCTDLEPKITNIIAAAATRTCEGELRQVIQRHNWQLNESEYIDIITEKSAAFFSSCCHLGALLVQATEAEVESLARFGLNAGIAFQITDDLLDLIGDESQTGKTVGSDVNKNKLTLAIIHLLRAVDQKEKSKLYNELNRSVGTSRNALLKMLKSCDSLEYAHSRAQEFVDKAIQALTGLKQSQAKEALMETAKFMAHRTI